MSRSPAPLALTYHGVADVPLRQDPDGLFVSPAALTRQIERLRSWGYRLTTFGELARLAGAGSAEGWAALTFDDGFVDNLDNLVPVLRETGAPATVFVISGWLGQPLPWAPSTRVLTADEVRALAGAGVEIGAHTVTHPDLSAVPADRARQEMAESRRQLERLLGRPVDLFAYPWGRATPALVRACAEVGYRAACRISGEGSWSEPCNLPRQNMNNRSNLLGLRLKSAGVYEPLMRRRAPRAVRRLARSTRRVLG